MTKPVRIIERSFFDGIPLTIWDYLYEINKLNEKYLKAQVLEHSTFCVDIDAGETQLHQSFLNPPRMDSITRNRIKILVKALRLECPGITIKVREDGRDR